MLETIFQRIGDRLAAEKHLTPKTDLPFDSTREEIGMFLTSMGTAFIHDHTIEIKDYPFEPSIGYRQKVFYASEIKSIAINAAPPSLLVGDEYVYISAEYRASLERFAAANQIPVINRSFVWVWLLEPFLDTELTKEDEERLYGLLNQYGLGQGEVQVIRSAVDNQMMKYNFDTLLWEWVRLDSMDVLLAMRPACYQDEFRELYQAVMRIALQEEEAGGPTIREK